MRFERLDQLIAHLEAEPIKKYVFEIAQEFQRLYNKIKDDKSNPDIAKTNFENDFFSFIIEDNKLTPTASKTYRDGTIWQYPDLKNFTEEQYIYLIQRQEETNNPQLKAQYSHILWLSPKKNIKYAHSAIASYMDIVSFFETLEKEAPNEHYGLKKVAALKNAFYLSSTLKYQFDVVKAELLRIVRDENFDSDSTFATKMTLTELMLDFDKLFQGEFIGLPELFEKLADHLPSEHSVIDLLEQAEKIDQNLGNSDSKWKRRIAELYEEITDKRENGDFVALKFCYEAINLYRQLKDTVKVEALEKRYKELRDEVKLGKVGIDIDVTETIAIAKKNAELFTSCSAEEFMNRLMTATVLLPKVKELKDSVDRRKDKDPLFHLFQTDLFDRKNNVSQQFSTEADFDYYHLLEEYKFAYGYQYRFVQQEIFVSAIKKEIINVESFLMYLRDHSWIGYNIQRNDRVFNWLGLIAPSIFHYFNQIDAMLKYPGYRPDFTLAIDSLSLKIEGLLRELCELNGIIPFYMVEESGTNVSREKDINNLLRDEKLLGFITEDDLFFLKFLLIEKVGFNLRNDVAHALLPNDGYTLGYMHLLIIAVLRLSKYQVKESI
jgi:hypothetical protein